MVEDQRAKQKAHGAKSDQGAAGQKSERHWEDMVYEGPEEGRQDRREAETNQPKEPPEGV